MIDNDTFRVGERVQQEHVGRELARLEARLNDGFVRIDDALASGSDICAWEDFWISLLHQYEHLFDEAFADAA